MVPTISGRRVPFSRRIRAGGFGLKQKKQKKKEEEEEGEEEEEKKEEEKEANKGRKKERKNERKKERKKEKEQPDPASVTVELCVVGCSSLGCRVVPRGLFESKRLTMD